jgi:hypothetical protein
MRRLTLAILAIAAVSMTKSATAHTYAPEYWCSPYGRDAGCVASPYVKVRWGYSDRRRFYFVSPGPYYNLGPGCAFYTMWRWPFTC